MTRNIHKSNTRRYRSGEEILELLDKFDQSEGTTIKEFCRQHNINKATYYNWRTRYRSNLTKEKRSAGFIEIVPSSSSATTISAALFAEVKGIRLYQAVSAEYLKTLAI
jgi:transposase-like protein